MNDLTAKNPWFWVIILEPGGDEQILGQQDREGDLSFIPTFFDKEEALQALPHLVRDRGGKHEIQAIRFNDLARQARESGFVLFMLNGAGEILEKVKP